ncbi:desiccation-related protein At2g46140-like [Phoenix dactylifera]|uniref:Desiccation-related protein At2g46140-like n=1 Tax=Phoenix dactylifera TaxID=42345 RepID=A0A8B7CP51_PHODC|nr:desiccation-related protein At2g46140-like [Phoenix dactylifera]
MASSDKPERKEGKGDEEKGGFLDKVKDFIHDVGEKIEETVGFGKPTADVTAVHIDSIDLERADLVVDVLVANPNPIPIPLVDINYLIESGGRKLVSGKIPDAGTIHAHGSETIKVSLTLIYDDIKSSYDDIEPGSVIPYKVRVELTVDLPVFGNITLPMEKNGEMPVPYKPEIDLQKIKFDSFSFEETSATLFLKVENMNDFDLGLNSLEYEMCLGEVSIGGARLSKSAVIAKKGNGVVELPISFRPKEFGSALWDMIRGKGTGYSMKGSLDVNTPFGPMKLPFHREGGSTKLKKADDDDSGNED